MNCMMMIAEQVLVAEPVRHLHRGRQHSRSRRLPTLDYGEWLVANSLKMPVAHRSSRS